VSFLKRLFGTTEGRSPSNMPAGWIALDETLDFGEGNDLSGATADYSDGRLVIRIPKSGLKQDQSSA